MFFFLILLEFYNPLFGHNQPPTISLHFSISHTSNQLLPPLTANCLLNFHFHFLDVREDEWLVVVHKYTILPPSIFLSHFQNVQCFVNKSPHTLLPPSPPPLIPFSILILSSIFYYGNSKKGRRLYTTDATAASDASDVAPATVMCVSSLDGFLLSFY